MKPVLFADLDDTLFRSLSRLNGDTEGLTRVTTATNGNHSWMTARQSRFFAWASDAMEIIPVTARSSEAFARVALEFPGLAVLSNGALILDADGRPDPDWSAHIATISRHFAPRLQALLAAVSETPTLPAGALRAWIISEQGHDIYLCVKSNNSGGLITRDLDQAEAFLRAQDGGQDLILHRNGNNLSLTPRGISKAAAVSHLLETRAGLSERITFGAGDSLSDLPFMALTDFLLVPPKSQIAQRLSETTAPRPHEDRAPAAGSAGSGSYAAEDVRFLLKAVNLAATDISTKEHLIQSGARHYSEMISTERRPDARYMEIFEAACTSGLPRIASELASLAQALADKARANSNRVALCSLVRAGVPYGVLLGRRLRQLGVEASHFGVSIIRDRGLDTNAMAAILRHYRPDEVVFVDGWTGKGTISAELQHSWRVLTGEEACLAVLADPCGRATFSGSREDWLIPSGILGGCISGLVSRSILNEAVIGPQDYHGCLLLDDMRDIDRSRSFVDAVSALMAPVTTPPVTTPPVTTSQGITAPPAEVLAALRAASDRCIENIMQRFGVTSRNLVKPGIAEATRAVLRRRPERVFLHQAGDPDLAALEHLCSADQVKITIDPDLTGPYRAITLIQRSQ